MANHSSILAWRIPMDRVHGVTESDRTERLSTAQHRDFPGGSVVKIRLPVQEPWVPSLVEADPTGHKD